MGTFTTLDDRFRSRIDLLFANGWQPADLAHFTRRTLTRRHTRLVAGYIAQHARRTDAPGRAPAEWLSQLHELGLYEPATGAVVGGHGDVADRWRRSEQLDPHEAVALATEVLTLLHSAPGLGTLIPPPQAWGASNKGAVTAPDGALDPKALRTIRALLAKAEGTNFEAEAEAFTAKAQELMTRHSIDAAMLAAQAAGAHAGIRSRRVHILNPYADEKAVFLAAIAHANDVRCVWSPTAGFSTLMGFPVDVQVSEVLFTSLLVQATHASSHATAQRRDLRTPSFRRAFLVSFANRIAERLEDTRAQVTHDAEEQYGSSLAPVLAQKDAAVEAAYREAFPDVTMMRARRYDAHGWHAGREAADRADIGAGAAITPG